MTWPEFGYEAKGTNEFFAIVDHMVGSFFHLEHVTTPEGLDCYALTLRFYIKNESGAAINIKGAIYDKEVAAPTWENATLIAATEADSVPDAYDDFKTLAFDPYPALDNPDVVGHDYILILWFDTAGRVDWYSIGDVVNKLGQKDVVYDGWPDPLAITDNIAQMLTINCYFGHVPGGTSDAATSIHYTGATLNGSLDDDGGDPEGAICYFEYGLTIAYGETTTEQEGIIAVDTFLQAISGLQSGKVYHYRAVFKNLIGTAYGEDATFKTMGAPMGEIV